MYAAHELFLGHIRNKACEQLRYANHALLKYEAKRIGSIRFSHRHNKIGEAHADYHERP